MATRVFLHRPVMCHVYLHCVFVLVHFISDTMFSGATNGVSVGGRGGLLLKLKLNEEDDKALG